MKILLISDSHGKNDIIDKLYKMYPNMDLYLHAGDSCTDSFSLFPFQSVRGNCDYDYNMMDRFFTSTPYGNLLMKHVPNMDIEELKKLNVKIYIFGHLHERHFYQEEGIYFISPGSTSREKDQYPNGYMILDITSEKVQAEFFDL